MKFTSIFSAIVGILFTGIGSGYLITIKPSLSSDLFNKSLPNLGINIDNNSYKYDFNKLLKK
tara:strand:- start:492 stop:677 length:186 start_codon:yes stop_codon:yes gene_type:complete